MKKIHWIVAFLTWLAFGIPAVSQIRQPDKLPIAQPSLAIVEHPA